MGLSKPGLAARLALTVLLMAFPWSAFSITITTFDASGAGANFNQGTSAVSINENGDVTGYFADANNVSHGFLRRKNGAMATFDVPGASTQQGTFPRSINNDGKIAGYYFDLNSVRHGFLRDENGTVSTFDPPGSFGTDVWSINNQGEIVGDYAALVDVSHAFLRHKDGTFTSFDAPGAGITPHLPGGTIPQSINTNGAIAGYYLDTAAVFHGFVRHKDGTFTTFDAPGVSTSDQHGTLPHSINAHGEIAGMFYAAMPPAVRGFVRRRSDGAITAFDPQGSISTVPLSINNEGEIAGYFLVSLPGNNDFIHGFVRLQNGTITTFDVPGAATGVIVGGTLPMSINAGGDVTGYYIDANGVPHGFVASEVE